MPSPSTPRLENIPVLAEPVLPLSLHGVNPRTLMGRAAWSRVKKQTQARAANHCEVCGRFVAHQRGDWIETHEVYDIDHANLVFRLARFIGLCSTCHQYAHLARTGLLVNSGVIDQTDLDRVIAHGERLLAW